MIQVQTLGTLRLRWMEEPEAEEVKLTRRKLLALLAILLLSRPEGYQRRDVLAGLLWGGLPDARARGALSQALYSLRSALGDEVIVARGHEEVGLDPARISCDLVDFERLVQEGRLEEALDLYQGELLSGFFLPKHRAFHEWLEGRRREVRDLAVRAARQGLQLAREKGDNPGALAWVRRLTALSPLDEEAHRDLLLLLRGSGDRTGAIEAHEEFVSRLRSELEVEPSAETLALAEAIRVGGGALPP